MTLNLLKRGEKGSAITASEYDQTLTDIEDEVNGLATSLTYATEAEVQGGSVTNKAVSPAELKPRECWTYALSDETTGLTTGTGKLTVRAPYAFKLAAVRSSVNTAPTGSTQITDINVSGSSILSTKLSIDAGEKTSTTAASAAVISSATIADDAEITFDIDQIGSTVAGTGLKVYLIGNRD
jgi:hypothetical protein